MNQPPEGAQPFCSSGSSNRGAAPLLVHFGFIVTGIVTTLLGPLLPVLIVRWSLSDERAGLFFTLQFCGNLAGIASLSALISRYGYRAAFGAGFTFLALGVAALNLGTELFGLLATALYGYGLGLVLPAANLWVAEFAGSQRAAKLTILNLAWGIGAVSSPALVTFAEANHLLALAVYGIAGCSAILAVSLGWIDLEPNIQQHDESRAQSGTTVRARTACALGVLFFLYVGAETSIGGWAAALATRTGVAGGSLDGLVPAYFWAGILAGRALGPLVLRHASERAALVLGLALAGAGNGALLRASTLSATAACLVVVGLGFAGIYPLLISLMVGQFGARASLLGNVIFALGSVGGATVPWLVGFTSTLASSLRAGLLIPMFACLAMIALVGLVPRPRFA